LAPLAVVYIYFFALSYAKTGDVPRLNVTAHSFAGGSGSHITYNSGVLMSSPL